MHSVVWPYHIVSLYAMICCASAAALLGMRLKLIYHAVRKTIVALLPIKRHSTRTPQYSRCSLRGMPNLETIEPVSEKASMLFSDMVCYLKIIIKSENDDEW